MAPPLITINKASPPLPALPATFASQPSFTQKILNFTIAAAQDPGSPQPTSFAGGLGSTVNINGARARVRIQLAGTPGNEAQAAIYGLSQSTMSQLATLGIAINSIRKNNVLISAGAASLPLASAANATLPALSLSSLFGGASPGFPVVFGGTIFFAYADFNQMPEVPFRMILKPGLFQAVQSVAPASYSGSTSLVSIFEALANALGVPLENNGVNGSLSNPYFPGTLMQQVYQAAEHGGINAQLVDGETKLAIWPLGGSRTSLTTVPLISKDTGMIRAPSWAGSGFLIVEFVYNPDVLFGGNIQVASDNVPQANGPWTVYKLDHSLDTLVPGGDWKTTALCYPQGLVPGPPPSVPIG